MVVSGGGDNFSACGFLEGALAAPQSELARSQVLLEVTGARAAVGGPTDLPADADRVRVRARHRFNA
jgi:hypothetical protein